MVLLRKICDKFMNDRHVVILQMIGLMSLTLKLF